MEKIIAENIGKLSAAQNAEETAKILEAAGQTVSEEEAEQLFKEIKEHMGDTELSADELEAVAGGADRDWLSEGCSASVEADSWCLSDDGCISYSVVYENLPVYRCDCGGTIYLNYEKQICICEACLTTFSKDAIYKKMKKNR